MHSDPVRRVPSAGVDDTVEGDEDPPHEEKENSEDEYGRHDRDEGAVCGVEEGVGHSHEACQLQKKHDDEVEQGPGEPACRLSPGMVAVEWGEGEVCRYE